MPSEIEIYRKKIRKNCLSLYGNGIKKTHETLHKIAFWCEKNNVDFENYGSGDLIEEFERKIADLLGFPSARFMPSGTLAQLIALRIWSDRSGCKHFAMHPTSHIEIHEERAYSHLHSLRASLIGPQKSPLLAEHFERVKEKISTLLVELPIREAGGQLPSWDELEELKEKVRDKGVRLHLDGARLWETKCFYNKEYSEICSGFDSVYVSFYKGIGALPGAMLLGPEDFIEEAKLWQRRSGGTLQTIGTHVASAAMQFDESLRRLPIYYERTKKLINTIKEFSELKPLPKKPQTNLIHIYLPFSAKAADAARDIVAEKYSIWMFGKATPAETLDASYFEIYVGESWTTISDEKTHQIFKCLLEAGNKSTA